MPLASKAGRDAARGCVGTRLCLDVEKSVSITQESGAVAGTRDLQLVICLEGVDMSEVFGDVTVSDLPPGSTLSAGLCRDDGAWTVPVNELDGLYLKTAGTGSPALQPTITARIARAEDEEVTISSVELKVAVLS